MAFKGLKLNLSVVFPTDNLQWIILHIVIVLILCVVLVLNLYGFPCTDFILHNFLSGRFSKHVISRPVHIMLFSFKFMF